MTTTNMIDAARVELLLGELRLPGVKLLTIPCAFVDRFLRDLHSYGDARDRLQTAALKSTARETDREVVVHVNTADDLANGSVYLTLSGTSADAGDDGQTGRGNRANNLINPAATHDAGGHGRQEPGDARRQTVQCPCHPHRARHRR